MSLPTFEQFAAVRRYGGNTGFSMAWSPDSQWLAYVTNITGQFNVWKQPAGGGYPVQYIEPVMPIHYYAHPIHSELERQFPGVRLIGEPGRFISAPCMTLVASVMGKVRSHSFVWP